MDVSVTDASGAAQWHPCAHGAEPVAGVHASSPPSCRTGAPPPAPAPLCSLCLCLCSSGRLTQGALGGVGPFASGPFRSAHGPGLGVRPCCLRGEGGLMQRVSLLPAPPSSPLGPAAFPNPQLLHYGLPLCLAEFFVVKCLNFSFPSTHLLYLFSLWLPWRSHLTLAGPGSDVDFWQLRARPWNPRSCTATAPRPAGVSAQNPAL